MIKTNTQQPVGLVHEKTNRQQPVGLMRENTNRQQPVGLMKEKTNKQQPVGLVRENTNRQQPVGQTTQRINKPVGFSRVVPLAPPFLGEVGTEAGPRATWSHRRAVETELFRLRDGKALGRKMRELMTWDTAHKYAVAPKTAYNNDTLRDRFQKFCDTLPAETPWDEALIKFGFDVMKTASPKTADSYIGRLTKTLTREGHRGVRTLRLKDTRTTFTRTSTYIRPRQAPPLTTVEVTDSLRKLVQAGQETAAALFATAWVSRARVPDLRFMVKADWVELNTTNSPLNTEAAVFAKEKGCKSWCPEIYMPAGPITAIAVEFWRKQKEGVVVFGGDTKTYDRLKAVLKKGMPEGSWLHSIRHGASRMINAKELDPELNRKALRHTSFGMTRRYQNSLNSEKRGVQKVLLGPLQQQ